MYVCLWVYVAAYLGGLLLNLWCRAFAIANIYPCQRCSMAASMCISRECTVLLVCILISVCCGVFLNFIILSVLKIFWHMFISY